MHTFNTADLSRSTNVASETKKKGRTIHVDVEYFFILSFNNAVNCKFYSVLEERYGMGLWTMVQQYWHVKTGIFLEKPFEVSLCQP